MEGNIILTIILSMIGSSALFSFIQFLISRHDNRKGAISNINKCINELKDIIHSERRALLRLQIVSLIHICPENVNEIMTVAEEYFVRNHGDWYMTTIFREYVEKNGYTMPIWGRNIK